MDDMYAGEGDIGSARDQQAAGAPGRELQGQLDLVVSAGAEMMSRVPMGSGGGDLSDKLLDRWQIVPQGVSAEVIAEEWDISREELDEFSLESHRRAIAAVDEGRFENEIVPVETAAAGAAVLFAVDEAPRRDTEGQSAVPRVLALLAFLVVVIAVIFAALR